MTRSDVAFEKLQAELEAHNEELRAINAELVETNTALTSARDRFRALHDLAPVPLVTIDAAGVVVEVNHGACALFRAPREHLIGRRLLVFVAETKRGALAAVITRLFAATPVHGFETELALEDGAVCIEVRVEGAAMQDDGRAVAVLALVDVTLENANERRAHEAHRLESLGVLAGGIAHTFNNLLTVVLGGTDHVLQELGADSSLAEPLREVHRAAAQAGALAHQMLAYSGHGSEPAHRVALGALIQELEPLLRSTVSGVALDVDLAADVPPILGDAQHLREVVVNVVVNAAEAMTDRHGKVTLTLRGITLPVTLHEQLPELGAEAGAGHVLLEVRDQGAGMDAATSARAFDPYFSTRRIGRGLGLSVVRGIVRAHRGAVTIDSRLGHGTTFRIYFPGVAVLPTDVDTAKVPARPTALTGRVLIVDDDVHVIKIVTRIIERLGLVVISARGGAEAIELVRSEGATIDLVLMDLSMPEVSGLVAGTAIRALYPTLPMVLVTGFGEIPPEAGSVFSSMLAKPFNATALGELVGRYLGERGGAAR